MENNIALFGKCPYATVQKILGGKWTVLIIYNLRDKILRFGELKRRIPDVTQATLTKQLRNLEEFGIIERKVYPEVPPKVEYSLSEIGQEFISVLDELELFGEKYIRYLKLE